MTYSIAFVLEQTLGHATHDENLRRQLALNQTVSAAYIPIKPWEAGPYQRLPFRASLMARAEAKAVYRQKPFDAIFYHTQVTAMFSGWFRRRMPTVISLDATPINMDALGTAYHRVRGTDAAERVKFRLVRRMFSGATRLVSWSQWAADSLVKDYGIPPEKIEIIPPGIDLAAWAREPGSGPQASSIDVRLLFVGGDFKRKGGEVLLEMIQAGALPGCSVDIVTNDPSVAAHESKTIRVHNSISANTTQLRALFTQADIFVLPTFGDTLGIALIEAQAAGLPVISSEMAGIPEVVSHGITGLLTAPGDRDALGRAILSLSRDENLRRTMGQAARRRAALLFDASRNYQRIIDLLTGLTVRA